MGEFWAGIASFYLPHDILRIILGIFLVFLAMNMLINGIVNFSNDFKHLNFSLHIGAFLGILIGFSSGLLGLGGGIFLIPTLVFVLGFSMKKSIGISLIFIFLTAIGGTASYILTGWGINPFPFSFGYINLINFLCISLFSIPAAHFGAKLAYKLPEKGLEQIFGVILLYMGIKILGLDPLSYLFGI